MRGNHLPRRDRIDRSDVTLVAGLAAVLLAGNAMAGVVMTPQPWAGEPLNGLTAEQRSDFLIGQGAYNTPLAVEEGLGPIFNKESCGNCHSSPLGGTGSQTVTRFGSAGKGGFMPLDQFGGSLLQHSTIDESCIEVIPPEANITAGRVTNGMMGYGLVEAILDQDILDVRDAQPVEVRGRANMVTAFEDPVEDPPILHVGRFGWKAQVATILTFSADAALNEMGLTNRFVTTENDPNGIRPPSLEDPDFCDEVADPEDNLDLGNGVDKEFIDIVADFQRFLAPPPQTPRSGMTGEVIFTDIGCAVCHHPIFLTPDDAGLTLPLRNKKVKAYSDFLLHDMGLAADFIGQGPIAEPQWMKTPPLMGLRTRDPIWHDGHIAAGDLPSRVTVAIAEHGAFGSQAISSAEAFNGLSQPEKDQFFAFLDSLGRVEFDSDGDGDVEIDDFHGFGAAGSFAPCFGGGPYTADDPCAVHDIDQDGDVDLDDFDSFLLVYDGPLDDCNENLQLDLIDVLLGVSNDINNNGVPDECCTADIDNNGQVDVLDLIQVILAWGPCPGCPADLVADGVVDIQDLLEVIIGWNSCS